MCVLFSFLVSLLCTLEIRSNDELDSFNDGRSYTLGDEGDYNNGVDYTSTDIGNGENGNIFDYSKPVNNSFTSTELNNKEDNNSVYYKASSVSHSDLNKNLLVLSGNAEIKSKGFTISGDNIIFNTQDNTVESKWYRKDNVFNKLNKKSKNRIKIIDNKGQTIFCDGMKYNVDSNRGVLKNVLLFKDDVIILSKYCKIDYDGTYYCKHLSLTSCKAKRPDWALLLDKATIYKNNLILMYGTKLMVSGSYFPLIKGVGLPILIPERYKSGLKYPESVNFSNDGGLAIKNFGFYIYISKYRDLNCNVTVYLGNSSVGFSLIHNYIIGKKLSGKMIFLVDKVSLYNISTENIEMFRTNWSFLWRQSTLNYENYEFTIDIDLKGTNSDIEKSDDDDKNTKIDLNLKAREVLYKKFSLNLGSLYNRDFKKNIENIELLYINLKSKQFKPTKFIDLNLNIDFTSNISNENKKNYVKDEHDVDLKDDILNGDPIITKKSIKKFFKEFSTKSLLKKMFNISKEFKINVPFNISKSFLDNYTFGVVFNYDSRLFFSKYDLYKKKIDSRFFPYYVHNFSTGVKFNIRLKCEPLHFDEFHYLNIFKIKEINWFLDPSISFIYSPSCNKLQKLFLLSEAYHEHNGKLINLFYHTKFGNVQAKESATVSLNIKNVFAGKKNRLGEIENFNIFNLNVYLGYDFLKEICKMKDIDMSLGFSVYKFNISAQTVIFPYYYIPNPNYTEENKEDKKIKCDDFFINRKDVSTLDKFKKAIMSVSLNVGVNIFQNGSKKTKKEKTLEDYMNTDDVKYSEFYIWENLNMSMSYSLGYKYNPIRDERDFSNTTSINTSTMLSKKCNVNGNIVYDLKDNIFSSFSFNGDYDLHCWKLSFSISLNTDRKKERSLSYNVNISPKNEFFSAIGQTRSDNLTM